MTSRGSLAPRPHSSVDYLCPFSYGSVQPPTLVLLPARLQMNCLSQFPWKLNLSCAGCAILIKLTTSSELSLNPKRLLGQLSLNLQQVLQFYLFNKEYHPEVFPLKYLSRSPVAWNRISNRLRKQIIEKVTSPSMMKFQSLSAICRLFSYFCLF